MILLRNRLGRALERTAATWEPLRRVAGWVREAAQLLGNEAGLESDELQRRFAALLARVQEERATAGEWVGAVDQFLGASARYGDGLFHCYTVAGLPRTNNALEQCFGSVRRQERRATGRKGASPALVVRGSVRLTAAVATRWKPLTPQELRPRRLGAWRRLRKEVAQRHQTRSMQRRFRKDPAAFLSDLETRYLQLTLPS